MRYLTPQKMLKQAMPAAPEDFLGKMFKLFDPTVEKSVGNTFMNSAASQAGKTLIDNLNTQFFTPKPSMGESIGKVLQTIGVGLGVGGGMAGLGALIDKYNIHRQQLTSPMQFQDMLMKNNDLNSIYLSGDDGKTKIEDLYKLLEHLAPKISENPIAAGAFIRQYVTLNVIHPDALKTLVDVNRASTPAGGNDGLAYTALNKLFEQSIPVGFSYNDSYGRR